MAEADAEVRVPADAGRVWEIVGSFGALAEWHPGVARCTLEAGGRQRRLALADGGEMVEALLQHDDSARAYSYRVVSSPLSVESCQALLHVEDDGAGGALVRWSGRFDVAGEARVDEVEQAVQGLFESGLEHLRGMVAD